MGLLVVLFVVVFGFGVPFLLSDSGSRPSDRLSDGYGVPRQWFDAEAVNRYARFGRSVRYLGLGLGGILGWGIARVTPVAEGASLYRCEPAAGSPSVIIRAPFAPMSSDPVVRRLPIPQTTLAPESTRPESTLPMPTPLVPATGELQPLGQVRSQSSVNPAPNQVNNGSLRWDSPGVKVGRSTVVCRENSFPKFGIGISRSARLDVRGFLACIAGALLGMSGATFVAERRSPALVIINPTETEDRPRKSSRTWGAMFGPALLIMLIAPARNGNTPPITLVYPLAFILMGIALGVRVWRNATKERSIEHPYAALHPRSIQDYVPGKLGLGWFAALAIFCAVVAGNGTHYHLNDPTQWFSSPAEYWIAAASLLAGAICVVAGSIGVVRSIAALDANDPRALIVDDARRACAVQRLIGASMLLLMSAVTRFSENGHLGILALPSTILSFWGAVVWCSPAGIPPQTAERWKSLFSMEKADFAPRETAAVERALSRDLGEGSGVSR